MDNLLDWMRQQKAVRIILAVILVFGLLPITSLGTAFANDPDILSEEADGTEGQYAGTDVEAYQTEEEPATLSGTVWLDANADGIRQIDEELVEGARVYLMDTPRVAASPETYEEEALADETAALAVAVTGAQGGYSFEGVGAGDYFVKVDRGIHTWPADYSAYNKVGSDGYTRVIAVASGSAVTGIDAGLTPAAQEEEGTPSDDDDPHLAASGDGAEGADAEGAEAPAPTYANTLSGFMWADKVNDGVYMPEQEVDGEDVGEWPIAGWTVYLLRAGDQSVAAETTTGADGRYEFSDIEPGDYVVKPFYNKPDTQEYQQPRIGCVGANKILSAAESRDWAGTTGVIAVANDSQVSDLDIGMKVKPGYLLQASSLSQGWRLTWLDEYGRPLSNKRFTLTGSDGQIITLPTNAAGYVEASMYVSTVAQRVTITINFPDLPGNYFFSGITEYSASNNGIISTSRPWQFTYALPYTNTTINAHITERYIGTMRAINTYTIIEKYEDIDTNSEIDTAQTSYWNSGSSFSNTPASDINYNSKKYGIIGYYFDDDPVLRTTYPVEIDDNVDLGDGTFAHGIYANHTIRYQYGELCNVTFDADGGSPSPVAQEIAKGGKAAKPVIDPDKSDGSKFVGWYDGTYKWDFDNDVVTSNVELKAKYAIPTTVYFDANYPGAPAAEAVTAYEGELLEKTTNNPSRGGYAFDGKWYKDTACTQEWNFATDTVPVGGTTLYAGWTQLYNVTYKLVDRNNVAVAGLVAPAGETDKAAGSTFGPVTAPNGASVGKVYVGWKDGLGGTLQSAATPITGILGAANKEIYLVYGTDNGKTGDDPDDPNTPDGKEDVVVTRHFKATDGTALTGKLTPTKVVVNLEDSPYATAETGVQEAGWTYKGWNTDGSTSSSTPGAPSVALTADTNVDVYYMYEKSKYTVTVKKVDRQNNSLGTPQTVNNLTHGFNFNKTSSPAIDISNPVTQTTLIGWKIGQGGTVTWNKSPQLTVSGATDLYLIYGQDKGNGDDTTPTPDGIEDVTITKQFQLKDAGTTLASDKQVYRNVPGQFTESGDAIGGYTYWGYELDGDGMPTIGDPSIALVGGMNHTVTYLYTADNQNITLKYEKKDGTTLKAAESVAAKTGTPWQLDAGRKTVMDGSDKWILIDWKYEGDASWKGNTNPAINPVPAGGKTVVLRYGHDDNDDGIEDVRVTKQFRHNGVDIPGNPAVTVSKNIGSTFNDAAPGITGYNFKNWQVGSNPAETGTPNISITSDKQDFTITYNYDLKNYSVTVHYVDRSGATVAADETLTNVDHFFTLKTDSTPKALTVKPVSQKCFVAWKVGATGTVNENTTPSVAITGATDIYLIYGQDKVKDDGTDGQDGVEDFDITEIHKQGSTELSRGTITLNKGKTYTGGPLSTYTSAGYTYTGYQIDSAAVVSQPATPSITNLAGAHTVTINYSKNAYQVKVHHLDRSGTEMTSYLQTVSLEHGYVFSTTSTPTAIALPNIPEKTLVGWKVGSGAETWDKLPTATITGATDIYLIYGQDKVKDDGTTGKDGIEDFDITETHKAGSTTLSTNTVTLNKGKAYNGQPSATHLAAGYEYVSYELDGAAAISAPAKPAVANVQGTHAVTFNYALKQYEVKVTYEDRDGNALAGSQTVTIDHGSAFNGSSTPKLNIPSFTEKCLADWKLDGTVQGNKAPGIASVTKDSTIVLIYGQDKVDGDGDPDPDGVEDFDITVRHWTQAGGAIIPDTTVTRNVGETFAPTYDASVPSMGYTYTGYDWDSDATVAAPGMPSKIVSGKHTLTFRFTPNNYQVRVFHEDRDGNDLGNLQTETSIVHGSVFSTGSTPAIALPPITGKVLVGWKIGKTGTETWDQNPSATITGATDIYLIYGQDIVDGDGDPGPDGVEDFNIVETHKHGSTVLSTKTVTLNKGKAYNGAADAAAIGSGYTYESYAIAGGASGTKPALPAIASLSKNESVTFLYSQNDYNVVVTYEDRDGNALPGSQTEAIVHGSNFDAGTTPALVVPTITDMCLVDWKLDGVSQNNVVPKLTNVTQGHEIVLVYGQDKVGPGGTPGGDSIEDFNILESHIGQNGLISTNTVTLNKGETYTGVPLTTAGLTYVSHKIDIGSTVNAPAVPVIANLAGNHMVVFNYTTTGYTMTVESVDRAGTVLGTQSAQVAHGSNFDTSTKPKLVVPSFTGKIFVDWYVDGGSPAGNVSPGLTNVTGPHTVTLVYGQDKGGSGDDDDPQADGKEDVTITKQWVSDTAKVLAANKTVYRNVEDSPFTEAGGSIAGYTYSGYKIDGGALVTTSVSVAMTGGTDFTITYVYTAANQNITLQYEDRGGNEVRPAEMRAALTDSTYAPAGADVAVTGYTLIDWKLSTDASWRGNATPSADVPAGGFTMILRYGQDKVDGDGDPDPDGIEDVTITKKWETEGGVTLAADQVVYRNIPGPFTEAGGTIGGYGYTGYKINNGAKQTGNPSITLVGGQDVTVTYLYTAGGQSITLQFVDRAGGTVKSDVMTSAATASTFTPTPADLSVTNYVLVDWKLSTDASWRGNTTPSETVPAGGFTMILRYGQDKVDGDGDPDPDGIEDVTITKKWETTGGVTLKAAQIVNRNIPGPFADADDAIGGWTYKGYSLDGAAMVAAPATPSVTLVGGVDHTVVYLYADETAPAAPEIDPIKPGATVITGTGDEEGNTITVTFPDGTTATGVVQPDGSWSIPVPGTTTPLEAGETVSATETDPAGNESLPGTRVVAPEAPTIDPIYPDSTTVTGEGTAGDTIVVTFPDGATTETTTVKPDGTWEVPVPAGVDLEPGDEVTAIAIDPAGNESEEAERAVSPYPPVIDPVQPGDETITGEGTPGSEIEVTFPDGSTETTTVEPDGTWEVPVPAGVDLEEGDEIEATEKDPATGESSKPAEETVHDTTAPAAPAIDPVHPGATVITGEGDEAGNTITVTFPDGSTATGVIQPDGSWSVPVPAGTEPLEPGDVVKATETDPAGNVSPEGEKTVSPAKPTIDPIYPDSTAVTGEGTAGDTIVVTFPDGITTETTTVKPDGTWEVPVPAGIDLKPGDEVTAIAVDDDGNESEEAERAVSPYPPVIDPVQPGDETITGEGTPGNEITVTFPDSTTTETTVVKPDGTWEVPVPAGTDLEEGDVVTATETDPGTGETSKPAEETVHDTTAPTGMTLDDVYVTDTTVSGTSLEPGNTVTVTFPDGSTATAVVQPDGTWTANVPTGVTLETGDTIVAVETDAAGNDSAPVDTIVRDVKHTVTVTYEYKDGTPLAGSQTEQISHRAGFDMATTPALQVPTFTEKVLTAFTVNGVKYDLSGAIMPLSVNYPGVASVTGPTEIVLIYGQDKVDDKGDPNPDGIEDFTITEIYKCTDNHGVLATNEVYVNKGANYNGNVATQADHQYTGHTINGGAIATGTPVILNVQEDQEVVLLQGHLDEEDNGNYDFVKTPKVKNAKPGSTVEYTLSNFGNKWGKKLTEYTISDAPDKGLDFVSASLPAFSGGTGMTYDVVIYTNANPNGFVHESGVSAASAHTVTAPTLANGEYITMISFEFGDAEADFAKGDTLTLTFRVWNNPPSSVLGNKGYLSYKVDGADKDFTSDGDGTSITVDGNGTTPASYNGKGTGTASSGKGLAKMGDFANVAVATYVASLALLAVFAAALKRRRQKQEETF